MQLLLAARLGDQGLPRVLPDGRTTSADILELLRDPRRAAWAQTAMVVDALRLVCHALDYLFLRLLRNQSIFNFVAIPATMAPAMRDLCFMNPEMFEWNIKSAKPKWPRCVLLPFPSSSPFYPNHSHG